MQGLETKTSDVIYQLALKVCCEHVNGAIKFELYYTDRRSVSVRKTEIRRMKMRVVKEHDVRRKELLDTAERLFITKGFNQTTINDIRQAVGIAKGTFYHYFKSKDDILDAMIERIIDQDLVRARAIVEDQTISPIEKIAKILLAQRPEVGDSKESMIKVAHEPENLAMHVKTIVQSIQRLSPVITEVIIQGIDNGDFHTNNPRTVMDMLLISGKCCLMRLFLIGR